MSHKDTIASEVISSSLGGVCSASILYPLEVLKTRMQADNDGDGKNETMVQFARKLYEKEGAHVFFKGIETSAFQSGLEKVSGPVGQRHPLRGLSTLNSTS